ncbi:glycosyltransferase involved in cell wall biosynthesis [Curtobacterium flaccumfaciens]|uniref:Glycosyltransferase involved in cell wall biosynthesis n=1 Tax=Curtobacterium salicis TaxID=1779862 RepID=A0ABX0T5R8_9MICO|nr:glycosyltransferase [Curtobacterium sp. WW7]NII40840.1 glycosyltransferase involved in cell wall biosynthesis [Curtobacterium sp. WW7]
MSRFRSPGVVLYDPNGRNPYGNELAVVFGLLGIAVHHWVPRARDYVPDAGIRVIPGLAGPIADSNQRLRSVARRFTGPLRSIILQPLRRPVVAAWNVDIWDMVLLGLRAALGAQVLVVLHNPRQVAGRSGRWVRFEKLLLARCTVCVHSVRLQQMAAEDFPVVKVTPHPPFLSSVRGTSGWTPRALEGVAGLPRVSFIGDPRPDKGVNDIPAIAAAVGRSFELQILASGRAPQHVVEMLAEHGVLVRHSADDGPLSDGDLIAALLTSSCVVAPYRSVTESGSIRLATAVGVPVFAYDTDGVREILPRSQLAASPEALGEMIGSQLRSPAAPIGQLSLEDQLQRSLEAWKDVLRVAD